MSNNSAGNNKQLSLAVAATILSAQVGAAEQSPFAYGDSAGVVNFWEQNMVIAAANIDTDAWVAYSNSGFTWSDVLLLANYWGLAAPGDAKVKAGSRILAGGRGEIAQLLAAIKNPPSNSFSSDDDRYFAAFFAGGYDWDDAVIVARYFGLDNPADAKLKAGSHLAAGQSGWVEHILQLQRDADRRLAAQQSDEQAYAAFFDNGFGWDDAEIIAAAWGLAGAGEAKLKAGEHILQGGINDVRRILAVANRAAQDSNAITDDAAWNAFVNSGYDWSDAVRLELAWGLPSSAAAKLKIGLYILTGQEHELPANVAPGVR